MKLRAIINEIKIIPKRIKVKVNHDAWFAWDTIDKFGERHIRFTHPHDDSWYFDSNTRSGKEFIKYLEHYNIPYEQISLSYKISIPSEYIQIVNNIEDIGEP